MLKESKCQNQKLFETLGIFLLKLAWSNTGFNTVKLLVNDAQRLIKRPSARPVVQTMHARAIAWIRQALCANLLRHVWCSFGFNFISTYLSWREESRGLLKIQFWATLDLDCMQNLLCSLQNCFGDSNIALIPLLGVILYYPNQSHT